MIRLKIKELRFFRDLSVREVSEETGIRWNTLSAMEKGTAKSWDPEYLEVLMRYFNLEKIEDLIEYVAETSGEDDEEKL